MRAHALSHRLLLSLTLSAAALAASACGGGSNTHEAFAPAVTFDPLEPMSPLATLPAATVGDPHPQALGPIVAVDETGHYASHARGYVHAPLAKVYEALHDPAASYIHNDAGGTRLDRPATMNVEPFPISFVVHYSNATIIGDVKFDVTYRGGPLQGTDAAPIEIGLRYQKTWGTSHIQVMEGSLTAVAVDGAPDVTEVEMIAWLRADTQGQSDCDGTVSDLYGDLLTKLASMP
jgi:hypothetical protein